MDIYTVLLKDDEISNCSSIIQELEKRIKLFHQRIKQSDPFTTSLVKMNNSWVIWSIWSNWLVCFRNDSTLSVTLPLSLFYVFMIQSTIISYILFVPTPLSFTYHTNSTIYPTSSLHTEIFFRPTSHKVTLPYLYGFVSTTLVSCRSSFTSTSTPLCFFRPLFDPISNIRRKIRYQFLKYLFFFCWSFSTTIN